MVVKKTRMGRRPLPKEEKRTEHLAVICTRDQRKRLEAMARTESLTFSQWALSVLLS